MTNRPNHGFQRDLIISLLLHLVFIILLVFGMPQLFQKLPEESQVITFEVLKMADINNVRNQAVKTEEPREEQAAREIKKSAPQQNPEKQIEEEKVPPVVPVPLEEKKTEPIKKEETKEETKPEKIEEKETPLQPLKETPEKQLQKDKQLPKPLPKKPVKKPEDIMDSLLKNLEKESVGEEAKSLKRNSPDSGAEGKFAKGNHDEDSPLSITEKMLIRKQIEENWRPPSGATNMENVQVILHLRVQPDGVIMLVEVKDIICPTGSSQTCELVAESAKRAAKKASPLVNLRPERYDIWKEFDLRFDPANIMR